MQKQHFFYLLQVFDKQLEEFLNFSCYAVSDKTAREALIKAFNETSDETYRSEEYNPDGPLVTALIEDDLAFRSYIEAIQSGELNAPYGSLCYQDFFQTMDMPYQILKFEGPFNHIKLIEILK